MVFRGIFHSSLYGVRALTAAMLLLASGAFAQNPLHSTLLDFEDGNVGGAVPADLTNSSSGGATNSSLTNVVEEGSKRLQLTDPDGTYNGAVITIPNAITQAGYYLITADVKVDNPGGIRTFGMGVVAGGPVTTRISDVNAGYVMNLTGTGDGSKGYQTIGAAITVPAGGSFPQDLTLYFGSDISGNTFNGSAFDGNYSGAHRFGTTTWAAATSNAVYIDNIKRIGPGNFGEERHLWISLGDSYTNLAQLESQLVAAKANNFNCVDILARYRADAYYIPNRTDATYFNPEPLGTKVGGRNVTLTNDPLQYAIDRGHELGLKVYISFGTFMVSDLSTPYPANLPAGSIQYFYNGGSPRPMLATDPSAEGLWADPGRADVRNYTKSVLLDIVKNYDIDGVIFDRTRYPNSSYSYNPQALNEMGISGTPTPTDANFRTARRNVITGFLQDAYTAVTDLKPWVVVGTAPIAFADSFVDTYNGVMQYFPGWASATALNRNISFGVCDLYQPQFYRLWNTTGFEAPASNTRLMNKAQFGDVTNFSSDFGLSPGALGMVSPIFYHPNGADVNQSNANAQNVTDGRALSMSGFGFFAATRTLQDIALIRSPGASTAGVDIMGTPAEHPDYLMKADYDNVKPNPVSGFTASPQADGHVVLSWNAPAPAADGETAVHYLVYVGTAPNVRAHRANQVTVAAVTNTSLVVPVSFAGQYYYKIVPVDDYNNRGGAVEIGPISVTGEPAPPPEVIVDNPQATMAGTWTLATSAGDKFGADYRNKGVGTGAASLTFTGTLPVAGRYTVSEWHPAGTNRATNARHFVDHADGQATILVDQRANGGRWNPLGQFDFNAGPISAKIDDVFTGTVVMADAIKWSYVVQAPADPSGLSATAVSSSAIQLNWTDNSSTERNIIVSRSIAAGGSYSDIATLGINHTTYTDSGLTPDTTYYYQVRMVNSGGNSAASIEAAGTTLPLPPAAPSGIVASAASSSQIDVLWVDNSSNEDTFVVSRSSSSNGTYTDVGTVPANTATFASTGLSPATTYFFKVRAVNAGGVSALNGPASATTLPLPPAAPSGLVATAAGTSQINLTRTDNSSNEANFVVARSSTSGGPFTDIATLGANVTSYSNTGLTQNTTHFYVVRAVNAGGASPNSPQASATTQIAPPAAPSGLTATATSQSQINLTWTDNSSNESNFVVARATSSGGSYTDIATLSANVTSYSNTGLSPSTTYYYVVRATNAGGASVNSAQASATTQSGVPAAPINLAAAAFSYSRIDLTWSDSSTNEANFVVLRGTASGGPYTTIATLGANVTSYSNTGLTQNTTYYYVVRATNATGTSANSNQASAKTLGQVPGTPLNLVATWVGSSQANLTWSDNSGIEQNYVVTRSTTAGGPYTVIATLGANSTSYSNTGLAANTRYYYTVRATNAAGSSPNSNEVNVLTWPAEVIVDNSNAAFSASANWSTGTSAADKYGSNYRFRSTAAVSDAATWNYTAAQTRNYEVYAMWSQGSNRSTTAPYVVSRTGGTTTVNKNQQANGGSWQSLGVHSITAGANTVKLSCWTTTGFVVMADAVRIVPR